MVTWINTHWAKIGFFWGTAVLINLFTSELLYTNIQFLVWAHLSALLFHQFEEYALPGGFKKFYNENISGKSPLTTCELNNTGVLTVNVVLGWSAYLFSAIYYKNLLWLNLGLALITLVNGFLHILIAIVKHKYNPGLITSIFFLFPFGLYFTCRLGNIIITTVSTTLPYAIITLITGLLLIPTIIFFSSKWKG